MYRILRQLLRNSRAATAVEYGLIVALIVIAIMGALVFFAQTNTAIWNNISTKVSNT